MRVLEAENFQFHCMRRCSFRCSLFHNTSRMLRCTKSLIHFEKNLLMEGKFDYSLACVFFPLDSNDLYNLQR